jgi:hypothetical protein
MKDTVKSRKEAPHWLADAMFIVVGVAITGWTFLKDIPDQWNPFFAASLGLLLTMCGVISFLLRHVLSDNTKKIISRMDWKWSFDPKANWKCATQIIRTLMQNGQECYETSSIANCDSYEQTVLQLANVWSETPDKQQVFTRIFCFADNSIDKGENKCRQVFHQILDPSNDEEKKYGVMRDCIRKGKIRMLHYPHRLLTDYLIVKTRNGEYDCLLGVAPPKNKEFLVSAHICDEEAGDKLFQHLEHIKALAIKNCKSNSNGQNSVSSCSRYKYDHELNTLLPD